MAQRWKKHQVPTLDWRNFGIILFFIGLFLIGLSIYKDYSLSIDETLQRALGDMTLRYVFNGDPALLKWPGIYHGPILAVIGESMEHVLHPVTSLDAAFLRHLLFFTLFFSSVVAFYFLCLKHFSSRLLSLIGCVFLVLSPRIFGSAFFDPKDIPFFSFTIIAFLSLLFFIENRTYVRAIIHGITCAVAIDMRVTGIIIPALTIIFIGIDCFHNRSLFWKKDVPKLFVFLAVCGLTAFCLWPALWANPIGSFFAALKQMSHYPWPWLQLYNGSMVYANRLPWHYIPVWITISTPISYLVLATIGLISVLLSFFVIKGNSRERSENALFLCWLFLPILAVILLKSTLYLGWRHLYFVYPALILFSIQGLKTVYVLLQKQRWKYHILQVLVGLLITLNLSSVLLFMVRNHPFEYIYFNELVGGTQGAYGRFELDCEFTAYRALFESVGKDAMLNTTVKSHGAHTEALAWWLFPGWNLRLIGDEKVEKTPYYVIERPWERVRLSEYQLVTSVLVDSVAIAQIYHLLPVDNALQ